MNFTRVNKTYSFRMALTTAREKGVEVTAEDMARERRTRPAESMSSRTKRKQDVCLLDRRFEQCLSNLIAD